MWFFYPSGTKTLLKKQTLYLLKMAKPVSVTSDLMILRRVQQMAGYFHFDVSVNLEVLHHRYSSKSLNHLRSLLMSYFKAPPKISFEIPSKKDIQIFVSQKSSKTPLNADAVFSLLLLKNQKQLTCQVRLKWIKQKSWQIKNIHMSKCIKTSP